MKEHTAKILIPAPLEVTEKTGKLLLNKLKTFSLCNDFGALNADIEKLSSALKMNLKPSAQNADIIFERADLKKNAWQINISPEKINVYANDNAGATYAFYALMQMLFAASIKGLPEDALDCADIYDEPRFEWRGFMLDCARHFQSADFIKKFLKTLAAFRINSFHWHLADSQGWRYPSRFADKITGKGCWSCGNYTIDELKEINQCANELGIRIIPEVDVPGHSELFLENYREYNCDPDQPGTEFCIGNPETLKLLKNIYAELMEIFPDSPIIHIGGDEAETANWDKCPKCLAAMKEKNLKNSRELENSFMTELAEFIIERGRTPMIWGTCSGQLYPTETIIQMWLDIREPLKVIPHGNKTVYSVHNSLYFDYPANLDEPWETWMFELSEKGVYMTDPYIIWPEKVKDGTLGTEACLWTETIPQHRVMSKLFPRIFAYSECAWSAPDNKSWHDFVRRKELLDASGYTDYIKNL